MSGFGLNRIESGAHFNAARTHRYILWRVWNHTRPSYLFIGLNPSTADEHTDDPTIRRCVGFTRRWGGGGMYMANVFPYRCTNPALIPRPELCKNRDNFRIMAEYAAVCRRVIGAWGANPAARPIGNRLAAVLGVPIYCLRKTRYGRPEHPLYVPYSVEPVLWADPAPTAKTAPPLTGKSSARSKRTTR